MHDQPKTGEPVLSIENSEQEGLAKFESAIRTFLGQNIGTGASKFEFGEFDISAPSASDMEKVGSGEYEITNFSTSPRAGDGDKLNLHFYIGTTEIHLTGAAADAVYDLLESNNSEA